MFFGANAFPSTTRAIFCAVRAKHLSLIHSINYLKELSIHDLFLRHLKAWNFLLTQILLILLNRKKKFCKFVKEFSPHHCLHHRFWTKLSKFSFSVTSVRVSKHFTQYSTFTGCSMASSNDNLQNTNVQVGWFMSMKGLFDRTNK
jgi:hypothetical protein